MKYDHENALTANRNLQIEIDHLQSILKKESSGDTQSDYDALKIVCECLERELALKNKEFQEIVKQYNNYKTEIKCVNVKHDKDKSETNSLKDEKEILETKPKRCQLLLNLPTRN